MVVDLIDSMLIVNPEKRFTVDQCLAHPWMTQKHPGINDSTNGLVSGIQGLEMSRRGVVRERTLLSSINTVQVANQVPNNGNKPDIKIYAKNPGDPKKEERPDDRRDPEEFSQMGGKGDQVLYGDDASNYSVNDIAAAKPKGKAKVNGK